MATESPSISADTLLATAVTITGARHTDESIKDYQKRVNSAVRDAYDILTDTYSGPAKLAQALTSPDLKVFRGNLREVGLEKSSTRIVAKVYTSPSKWYPDGIEPIRTERTEMDRDSTAYKLGNELKGMKGNDVLLFVEMQTTREGEKVRILHHVKDLGKPRNE